jgi:hypothetical protein
VAAPLPLAAAPPLKEIEPAGPASAKAEPAAMSTPQPVSDLDGDWTDTGERQADTPIFMAMRSAWLSSGGNAEPWSSSEVEAGWDQADRVAEAVVEPAVSATGLPIRRPGTRLVPGGVTKPARVVARDPEAIRARLAAHAAGVSRGRSDATTSPDNPQTEADSA